MLRRAPLVLSGCLWFSFACGETHDAPSASAGAGGTVASAGSSPGSGGSTPGSAGAVPLSGGSAGAALGPGGSTGAGGASAAGATTAGVAGSLSGEAGSAGGGSVSLLVFSRTQGYRHDSIPVGIQALRDLASAHGFQLEATEDATRFTDSGLSGYDAVIFLSTSGDVLDDAQQAAFERFVRAGHGFIGIHSASDTEYDWAWYGGLVGAYFREHPAIQAASVVVEDKANPATAALPNPWQRTDEWYAFQSNPRPNVQVLLALDENSYSPGSANMNGDHPIAWCHEYDGGRAFYTALGHTSESYADPLFMAQLAGAVAWVLAK
ncbi:MAG TPA: ThuA domain-containing protein [Polyangiaceae bacterium]|nr:ThuA domain-containing protein [Polyangiaceae bacterium]